MSFLQSLLNGRGAKLLAFRDKRSLGFGVLLNGMGAKLHPSLVNSIVL